MMWFSGLPFLIGRLKSGLRSRHRFLLSHRKTWFETVRVFLSLGERIGFRVLNAVNRCTSLREAFGLWLLDFEAGVSGFCKISGLGEFAFSDCASLQSICRPSSIQTIGENWLSRCEKLLTLTFEPGSKCPTIGASAFESCSSLQSI
jgi:hypothetical protein